VAETTLIPLATLAVATHLATIKGMEAQAGAYAKVGAPGLPGIPDIKDQVKKYVEAEAKKLLDEARVELVAILVVIMAAGMAELVKLIPTINKVIRVLNKIINAMNAVLLFLVGVAAVVFAVILVLTIMVVITKIIGMIPSTVVAWGVGVSFDSLKMSAGHILIMCQSLLQDLWPIAFKIIAVLLMILKLYGLLLMIMGIIKMFTQSQTTSVTTAADAFNRSAEDWENTGNTTGDSDDINVDDLNLVECTLPSGEVLQMTAEACIAAGGTFPGMDILGQLNDLDSKIRYCESGDISHEECIELKSKRHDLCNQLGTMCDFQLGSNLITSLKNPHDDVTIKKAITIKGKRKGFYSEDI